MKKIYIYMIIVACICTACSDKTPKVKSEEMEFEELYAYETPFIFSQERVQNEVEYFDDIDSLVDEAIEIVIKKMKKAHDTCGWDSGVWTVWDIDSDLNIFDGKGFYISSLPITEYNNNRNKLWNSFTLFIFNENKTSVAAAVFSGFENKKLSVTMMTNDQNFGADYFAVAKERPEMEFINIAANYKKGNTAPRPNQIGGEGIKYISTTHILGDDNKIYYYDRYSDTKVKEFKMSYDGEQWTVEGDVFHSLPEEMRYSYDKIIDNLIWVEY